MSLRSEVAAVLGGLERGPDGIYSSVLPPAPDQADEIRERETVAAREYPDLLREIGRHHSIPVMDRELRRFLRGVPVNGLVIDVGGGWGWHWRRLAHIRPDIAIVVVDFVRANLKLAARMLDRLVQSQVFLVHGDATALPFPASAFDAYWSVQTLQLIPDFEQAVNEAKRVLRPEGRFACYSVNHARLVEAVYRVMGKPYHVTGKRPGSFYLARATADHARIVSRVFGAPAVSRYTEVLFHPDLRLSTGAAGSRVGAIDAYLSSNLPLLSWAARQRSFHSRKPA